MLKITLKGDWKKLKRDLNRLSKKLVPAFRAAVNESGELVLETLKGHIQAQDLNWAPLAEHTVELKGGDTTILVETGFLLESGFEMRKLSANGLTIYVGASSVTHPSGVPVKDLLIWIEYGTDKMPARPLMRPTMDEMKEEIPKIFDECLRDLLGR